jgi:hypothetical protein
VKIKRFENIVSHHPSGAVNRVAHGCIYSTAIVLEEGPGRRIFGRGFGY